MALFRWRRKNKRVPLVVEAEERVRLLDDGAEDGSAGTFATLVGQRSVFFHIAPYRSSSGANPESFRK
jgi:hypothetical protein